MASKVFKEVIGIERIEGLYLNSIEYLRAVDAQNVTVICGDGYEGVAQFQPYDSIIVSCCSPKPPQPLLSQLAVGGILVVPVGGGFFQELITVQRIDTDVYTTISHGGVRFVPLVSHHSFLDQG